MKLSTNMHTLPLLHQHTTILHIAINSTTLIIKVTSNRCFFSSSSSILELNITLHLLETKPTADHWQMLHKIVDELLKRNYEPHVLSALEEQVLHRRMDGALEHAYEHFKKKLAVIPDKNALPTSKTTHKTVWATDAEKVKHSACSQKQEHPSHIPVPVKGLHKEDTSLEADATRTHELALENASDEELIKLCEHFISCLDVIKSA
jgi:hypothetical protein